MSMLYTKFFQGDGWVMKWVIYNKWKMKNNSIIKQFYDYLRNPWNICDSFLPGSDALHCFQMPSLWSPCLLLLPNALPLLPDASLCSPCPPSAPRCPPSAPQCPPSASWWCLLFPNALLLLSTGFLDSLWLNVAQDVGRQGLERWLRG